MLDWTSRRCRAICRTGPWRRNVAASPDPFPGSLKYFPVEYEDHCQRNVESGAGGEDLVGQVLADEALLLIDPLEVVRVLPAELGCKGDYEGGSPHQEDHGEDATLVAHVDVVHVGHSPISENKKMLLGNAYK